VNPYKNTPVVIDFLVKPLLFGLAVAALMLVIFPELRSSINSSSRTVISLDHNSLEPSWGPPFSYSSAVARAAPAVVNIYTKKIERSNYESSVRVSLGSGVIMRENGLILTNFHVIADAVEILVLLNDGREILAERIGVDTEIDLALLKININNIAPISIGKPSEAKIGDVVLAIGNPSGIGQSVTQGIISAKRRSGLGTGDLENFIQTDPDISPGSSGGALIDAYGNLLGINTATLHGKGAPGISFAIPADIAEEVLEDLLNYGRVVRGWLGIEASLRPLSNEFNEKFGVTRAFEVTNTAATGPAKKSGIQNGDYIFMIDDVPVTDPPTSIKQITDVAPGQPVKIKVVRQGKIIDFIVTAGDRGLER
jgi:serine protease DegS